MNTVGALYRSRQIAPLPVYTFSISEIGHAYTQFSRFQHTGKLVLTYGDEDELPYLPSPSKPEFHSDAAYLIVGGLRGMVLTSVNGWFYTVHNTLCS